ncbi:peptidylprolyl isomerase [Cyanothece sp. BG0011]|uniref:peptidylprolyl isomerase n=1 Tax=Cyanothece sp. BG0011 TaxID=2082950 RepID=UPI000D1DD053|nr:peptidylprolyl isomerase [Cyanothece sp. BG0011]
MTSNLTTLIEVEEVIDYLKKNLKFKETCQQILQQRIINQASQQRNLTITDEEIQTEADKIRREKRLEKAADTLAWLQAQMITPDDWESGIRDKLLRQKLTKILFDQEVAKLFKQNCFNFDQVLLYQIIVPYEKLASEIFYQIEEEEMSFYQAAHLYDIDEKRRLQCGYEGKIYRCNIKPELSSVIFAANPGEVIPPFPTEQGYHIIMVEAFVKAQLTDEVYEEMINKMFKEWLLSELNYLLHSSSEQIPTTPRD